MTGNKFGSPSPKKITDEKYGMLEVTFFGEYAFKVSNPIVLVNQVIGANAKDTVTFDEVVGSQLKNKFVEKLTQAISVVMRKHKVSFGDMGLYGSDLSDEMNVCLDESWKQLYGLCGYSVKHEKPPHGVLPCGGFLYVLCFVEIYVML